MSIYVTLLAGCVLTMILGKFVLAELRKLKAGQEIRQDGPTWHNSKAGTPTMGGIAFILGSGIVTFACGWLRLVDYASVRQRRDAIWRNDMTSCSMDSWASAAGR